MVEHSPAQPNQSLAHGLDCLLALAAANRPVGSRELARTLGMEPTRANRLLGTLAQLGFAERTAERKYVPGAGLHIVAAMSLRGSRLLTVALPHICDLVERVNLPVALGMRWRHQVCYLYYGQPNQEIVAGIAAHDLYPADASSIGIMLLASQASAPSLPEVFPHLSTRDINALKKRLACARKEGVAHAPKGGSVAVAVGEPAVAGLAVSGHFTNVPKRTQSLVEALTKTAQCIADAYFGEHSTATGRLKHEPAEKV